MGSAAAGQTSGKPAPAPADDISFQISLPLKFRGKEVSGVLRRSEIGALLDLPVRNGVVSDEEEGYGAEMTRTNHAKFRVSTCRQWKKAVTQGAFAATTFDMAMESFLVQTCGLLFELQNAVRARKSFVAKVSLADLDLLPANILVSFDRDGKRKLDGMARQGRTVATLLSPSNVREKSADHVALEYGGFQQLFREAERADFNHDGIEDILVLVGGKAVGGTLGYADYTLLTRLRSTGPLTVIKSNAKDRP